MKNKKITMEFDFIPSGDGESFTFAVSKETSERLSRELEIPHYELQKNHFLDNKYDLYPNEIFGYCKNKIKVKIEYEIIEEREDD